MRRDGLLAGALWTVLATAACSGGSGTDGGADGTVTRPEGGVDSSTPDSSTTVPDGSTASDAGTCDADGGCADLSCCYRGRCITGGAMCDPGMVCFASVVMPSSCQGCGIESQPCCAGNVCNDGSSCVASPQGYRCLR